MLLSTLVVGGRLAEAPTASELSSVRTLLLACGTPVSMFSPSILWVTESPWLVLKAWFSALSTFTDWFMAFCVAAKFLVAPIVFGSSSPSILLLACRMRSLPCPGYLMDVIDFMWNDDGMVMND